MTSIVPRWEWRSFDDDPRSAEDFLAATSPHAVEESDEIYVLSARGDSSVKVRDGRMDVKRLEQVDGHGLELWRPVLKAPFPLGMVDVGVVISALGVAAPPPARHEYSFAALVDELVDRSSDLLAVEVHKTRRRYTVGGCLAEVTDVRTERGSSRTIAVESEDATRVRATVRELARDRSANVSFPRGLAALVGFAAERYATVDVGTNSVKLLVAERDPDGAWRTVADRAEITRLGEGLADGGRLGRAPIERTTDAVAQMVAEARELGVLAIAAVGTAGLRMSSNAADLIDAVNERCEVVVEVISGEEEARIAYHAARSVVASASGRVAVFDTGGGSSQFTFGCGDEIEEQFSVNVGAARSTDRFGLDGRVSESVLAEARAAIAAELVRLEGRRMPAALIGMGGAVTNLAAVKRELSSYEPDVVHGTVLDAAEIDRQIELYRSRTADERRRILGLQPKRAELILAGACIVGTVLDELECDSLVVSDRGLRHGLLLERFLRSRSSIDLGGARSPLGSQTSPREIKE